MEAGGAWASKIESIASQHDATIVSTGDESTITVGVDRLHACLLALRDHPAAAFEQLIDLCGVDYLDYGREGESPWQGARYAVVYHLLSVSRNDRLRVITWLDDDNPKVPSVINIWRSADWFEREAHDLYGIVFEGHPDLPPLLLYEGFEGYPGRKSFPFHEYDEW